MDEKNVAAVDTTPSKNLQELSLFLKLSLHFTSVFKISSTMIKLNQSNKNVAIFILTNH